MIREIGFGIAVLLLISLFLNPLTPLETAITAVGIVVFGAPYLIQQYREGQRES